MRRVAAVITIPEVPQQTTDTGGVVVEGDRLSVTDVDHATDDRRTGRKTDRIRGWWIAHHVHRAGIQSSGRSPDIPGHDRSTDGIHARRIAPDGIELAIGSIADHRSRRCVGGWQQLHHRIRQVETDGRIPAFQHAGKTLPLRGRPLRLAKQKQAEKQTRKESRQRAMCKRKGGHDVRVFRWTVNLTPGHFCKCSPVMGIPDSRPFREAARSFIQDFSNRTSISYFRAISLNDSRPCTCSASTCCLKASLNFRRMELVFASANARLCWKNGNFWQIECTGLTRGG